MVRKLKTVLVLAVAALLLGGCAMTSVSDLYCLPKRSEEYTNLQTVLAKVMSGRVYSAPLTGDNQQTVQAVDLDGDGVSEYVVFAKGTSDKPLQLLIFAGDGETYELLDTIESTGSDFDQVEYICMDERAGYEIVVGRQVSDQVARSVAVYTLRDGRMEQLLSDNYSEFLCSDLDGNGRSEVVILRDGDDDNGVALLYSISGLSLKCTEPVRMSAPAGSILRLVEASLEDGKKAVYAASFTAEGVVTDVFTLSGGALHNISYSEEAGSSISTLRGYEVYAGDIDGDGVLELPELLPMADAGEISRSAGQYLIRWYSLNSDGTQVDKLYTYHNFNGGWYLELDGALVRRFSVVQKGSSFEFRLWNEEVTESQKLMTVYVLTGQKREEQSVSENRFVLLRGDTTIYAANLEAVSATYSMTKESIVQSFHMIQEDWKTGET